VALRRRYRECTLFEPLHTILPLMALTMVSLVIRGGMIAPILGGILLMINRSIPVYTSVVIFAIAGFCVLLLNEEAGESARVRGKPVRVVMH
jgi:hypothetical protein